MKRIIALIIATCMIMCLTGCDSDNKENGTGYFVKVYGTNLGTVWVVYDPDTYVMYTISHGTYNIGSVTMLVNADGTPKLYKAGDTNV